MPVRSVGKLLAGIGALIGVCAAGTGCQTTAMHNSPLLGGQVAASRPDSVAAGSPGQGAPLAAGVQVSQAEQIVRPVSAESVDNGTAVASSWHGTDHISDGSAPAQIFVTTTPSPLPPSARAAMVDASPIVTDVPPPAKVQPVVHNVFHHSDNAPIVGVPGVPKEFEKKSYPTYQVEPPDVLYIIATDTLTFPNPQPLRGSFLVRMDGSINLGIYGDVYVAGLTLEQVKDAVAAQLKLRINPKVPPKLGPDRQPLPPDQQDKEVVGKKELTIEQIKLELQVDVQAFNSKVYYIITDGAGYGQQVVRVPATGNETVLDALGLINGLPGAASKQRIWIARATPQGAAHPMVLPVDWRGITQYGEACTNYQIFPGDRIFVDSQRVISFGNNLDKFLRIPNSILSTVLLGSGTVNSIRNVNGGLGNP